MLVLEIFDSPVPFTFVPSEGEDHHYVAKFDVNGKSYTAQIYTDDEMGFENWIIEFDLKGKTHLTGTGGEIAVFATVYKILEKFVTKVEPESFSFSSTDHEPSRVKLYTRMANNLSKKFGYELKIENDGVDETHFQFTSS